MKLDIPSVPPIEAENCDIWTPLDVAEFAESRVVLADWRDCYNDSVTYRPLGDIATIQFIEHQP